jgi:hypothetical protein
LSDLGLSVVPPLSTGSALPSETVKVSNSRGLSTLKQIDRNDVLMHQIRVQLPELTPDDRLCWIIDTGNIACQLRGWASKMEPVVSVFFFSSCQ